MNVSPAVRSSAGEQQTRVEVAAGYRLVHLYGLSDFTDGFVSARISDEPRRIAIGSYGLFPELARASALFCRSLDEEPVSDKSGVDLDAIRFTRMALSARPGVHACIHAHPKAIIALSALDTTLLPLSQWGIMYQSRVGYLDFTTTDVTEPGPCEEMRDLLAKGAEALILRNHGVLAIGKNVAQAFFTLHRLELACEVQLQIMQSATPRRMPDPSLAAKLAEEYWTMSRVDNDGSREWPGLLAKLDRLDETYRQ